MSADDAGLTAENDQQRDVPPEVAERHWCPRDMGDAASVPEGTYRCCAACGRWWRSVQTYRYWTESEWLPVRWWQWRRRQYIERHLLISAAQRCPTCIPPEGYDRLSGPCPTCGGDGVIPAGGSDD